MHIITPGKDFEKYPQNGNLKCKKCGTIFSYIPRDIKYENDWLDVGTAFFYVRCPNQQCISKIVLYDKRFIFGFIDRVFGTLQKAQFITKTDK